MVLKNEHRKDLDLKAQSLAKKDKTINELDFQKTYLENELKVKATKFEEMRRALDLQKT